MTELLQAALPWLSLLNLFVFPAIWWAARLSARVESLHKSFGRVQIHSSKIAVLEERTGGPILLGDNRG